MHPLRRSGLLVAIALVVATGCAGETPGASTPAGSLPIVASSEPASTSGTASSASASPSPGASATPVAVAGSMAGPWRVRRVLAPGDRDAFLPGAAFAEEAYRITATCPQEPCPTIEIEATPAGRSSPVTLSTLEQDGDRYVSAPIPGADVPCRNAHGDQIPGGANASSTLRLWLFALRPSGSAAQTIALQGVQELALTPTSIGRAAGCEPRIATYDLSGTRGAVAVIDRPRTIRDIPAGVATAPLPVVDASIDGAEIAYFDVEGTTVDELAEATGRGALRACGGIDYEWLEGSNVPSACTITTFPDFETALQERTADDGSCTIEANAKIRFTVHLPRWSGPERVPARLVDWWRETVLFIRDHEAGHVEISLKHAIGLDEQLDGARCRAVDGIVENWAAVLGEAQEFFDRREYSKPWPEPPPGA